MSTSQRSHTKSRRGCKQCKEKHVKCDEVVPSCGNCTRRKVQCDFHEWEPALRNLRLYAGESKQFRRASDRSERSPSQQATSTEQSNATTTFSAEDVYLMHHYTAHTCFDVSVVRSDKYNETWQKVVPQLAESCPFLLQGILAIAACHKASECGPDTQAHVVAATRHHDEAMRLFRESPATTAPERACAILPFSIMVLLVTLCLDQFDSSRHNDPIGSLIGNLTTSRSANALLVTVSEELMQSRVAVLLDHRQRVEVFDIPLEVSGAFHQVKKLLSTSALPDEELRPCQNALIRLHGLYSRTGARPQDWAHLLSWILGAEEAFFALLQRRQLPALVLLAHWCVLLHHAPRRWFFRDLAARTIHSVAGTVDLSCWRQTLDWPLAQIA